MGDFLLSFSSNENITELSRNNTSCIQVGTDKLVPVSAVNTDGTTLYSIDNHMPFKLLTSPDDAYR